MASSPRRFISTPQVAPSAPPLMRSSTEWQLFCAQTNITKKAVIFEPYQIAIYSRYFAKLPSSQIYPVTVAIADFAKSLFQYKTFEVESRALEFARIVSIDKQGVTVDIIMNHIDGCKTQHEILATYVRAVIADEISKTIHLTDGKKSATLESKTRTISHGHSETDDGINDSCDTTNDLIIRKSPNAPKPLEETTEKSDCKSSRQPIIRVLTRSFTRSLSSSFKGPGIGFFKRMFSRTSSSVTSTEDVAADDFKDEELSGGAVKRCSTIKSKPSVTNEGMTESERIRLEEYMKSHDLYDSHAPADDQFAKSTHDEAEIVAPVDV